MKEYTACLKDRMWRLCNLYYIKDKDGNKVKFVPNVSQRRFLEDRHGRDIILKARQLGFTTCIQIEMLDECIFVPNTNAGIVAHNQDDAAAFFKDKIKFAYDHLPPHIQELCPATNDSAKELRFDNDSVIRVGTSLRSGTFRLLHISEYGKLCAKFPDRAQEVKTGAMNTVPKTGRITIESTAEGRTGDFYDKCSESQKALQEGVGLSELDFKFHFFPWYEDPEYTLEGDYYGVAQFADYFAELAQQGIKLTPGQRTWYAKIASTQGEDMKREYPSTPEEAFEAAIEGAYFSRQMAQVRAKKQICNVPYDTTVPVHVFWDLGRDTTSLWFFQHIGFDYRFIDYFENDGEGMAYYLNVLKARNEDGGGYNYGDMYLPHDGDRKSMGADGSPADVLYENGYSVRIVGRTPDKTLSIERARQVIPMCWFDKENCHTGLTRLDGYRKEWDDKLGTWKKHPLHDINSHGADSFMTFADGYHLTREIEEEDEQDGRNGHAGRNSTTGY
jgi:hypothetical protein